MKYFIVLFTNVKTFLRLISIRFYYYKDTASSVLGIASGPAAPFVAVAAWSGEIYSFSKGFAKGMSEDGKEIVDKAAKVFNNSAEVS